MNNLFSHAPLGDDLPPVSEALEPVAIEVVVPGPVSQAFIGFTEHTHLWWPMDAISVFGVGSYVEFEENLIRETADDGRTSVWGSIDDWQPPLSFHASWHPGSTAVWSTELRVAFRAVDGGTEVRAVHSGWEGSEDPLQTRIKWDAGWPEVLARFVRFMGGAAD
jgi:hypothetical protein